MVTLIEDLYARRHSRLVVDSAARAHPAFAGIRIDHYDSWTEMPS